MKIVQLYKGEKVCSAEPQQVEAMTKHGWSKEMVEAKKVDKKQNEVKKIV